MSNYIQCKIERNNEIEISFIQEDKAILNKIVDIGKKDNLSKGWKITEVYDNIKLNHNQMLLQRDAHKNQRVASDL